MSDIHSTAYRYDAVCTELGRQAHPYILKMFEREKEDTVLRKKTGGGRVGSGRKSISTDSDFKDQMHLYLAGNNNLLTDKRIEDPDCEALYKTLQNNSYVTSLDLRYNLITDEGAKFIAKLIEETTKLTDLNLMCNEIGAVGAEHIAKALLKNESLKTLRMTGNKMGNKGGMWFAQALQVNTTLEALDVADTDLTIESIIAISTVLYNNKTLKALNINRPILFSHQEETTVHFAEMLKVNTTLKEVHFQKYDMRDFGMTRLAENLMHNDTLTYLDLSCNRITRDGINELSKVLEKNTAIEVLDLGYNRLEDDGAIHIANALASLNTNLKTLVVTSNNIGSKGLCALADAMKTNTTLTNIYIWGNKLEEPAAIAFANLIDNGRLSKENTDVQAYVVDGATKLCELSHQISRHTYFAPSYGDDVPSWQPRGKNPRGSDVVVMKNLTVY
ncbi:leucine-rich repeat-containing protein 34-like isoform X1 [Mytilus galloprovincialis]|uniref:leucine-rich repeat-containing protein 34-like isoform X1 n=1 Tax=Mytilus galloprovincialis TaxID=29158 RepID=UPI003F7CA724